MLDVELAPRPAMAELFDRTGVPYEEWEAAQLRARLPYLDTGRYWPPKPVDDAAFFDDAAGELGAIFTPDGGFVDDPALAARNLVDAAVRAGAEVRFRHAVTDVLRADDRVAGVGFADGSRISAPIVVNAAGPWSGAVNALAGVGAEFTIGLRPLRQEVHQVPVPPGYDRPDAPGPVIVDLDLGTYMRAVPGGRHLLVGGTEPACDPFDWVDDPDLAAPRPTAGVFESTVTRVARRLPELGVPGRPTGLAGVYDVADDWTPIYDRTDLAGFYVAVGTSGNQFKNAPVVGRLMAQLIGAVENGHPHDDDPVRYDCAFTGNQLDLGSFSRRREFNAASSGTVMG